MSSLKEQIFFPPNNLKLTEIKGFEEDSSFIGISKYGFVGQVKKGDPPGWVSLANPNWKIKREVSFYEVGSGSQEQYYDTWFGAYEPISYFEKVADFTIVIAGDNASSDEGYLPALNPFGLSSSLEDETGFVESAVINERVIQIFRDSEHELFEAGMESLFSRRLHTMIYQFGHLTLKALNDLLANRQTNQELLAETMRTVGRSADKFTENLRFRFLVEGLNHPSPIIRDSAALGLCDMEDPRAIPFLQEAIKKEKYDSLKGDFEQIIEELGAC